MKKIASNSSLIYMIICFSIFCFSLIFNKNYFNQLANDNIVIYQLKQVLCILFVFFLGYLFLKMFQKHFSNKWIILFSFPIGMTLWAFFSLFILLLEIPYRFYIVLFALALFIILIFLIRKFIFHSNTSFFYVNFSIHLQYILGTAFLVSTGFVYVILSYDSIYYFLNYGYSLTLLQNFNLFSSQDSYVLTNIGQFLPVVNALPAFWGLDQSYQIQTFLTINTVAIFYYGLFDYFYLKTNSFKRARNFSLLFTILLVTSTCFIFSATWVLANMYCMVFIFFSFIIGHNIKTANFFYLEHGIMLTLFLASLMMLRKDGVILAIIVLIIIATLNKISTLQLLVIFTPSILIEVWWLLYVRKVLNAQTKFANGTSLTSDSNVRFVFLLMFGTVFYIILRNICVKFFPRWERSLILLGLFAGTIIVFQKFPMKTIDNVDTMLKIIYRIKDSFGMTGFIFPALLVLTFLFWKGKHLSFTFTFCLAYALINFCAYDYIKVFTYNIDDSYTRVLMQIVPVMLYGISLVLGTHLIDHPIKEIEKNV